MSVFQRDLFGIVFVSACFAKSQIWEFLTHYIKSVSLSAFSPLLISSLEKQNDQVRQCILRGLSHAGPSAAQPCVAAMEPRQL